MICQFLPSMYIFYVKYFGHLAVVKTFLSEIWTKGKYCPLLFLIFINDIVKCIGASIRLFVDDSSLYIIVDLPDQAAIILNTDLKQFQIGQILGLWHSMQAKHFQ